MSSNNYKAINDQTTIPTHLFVGNETQLEITIIKKLQQIFCSISDNCFCNECRKIKTKQHPNVIWIEPKNRYVLDDLEVLFEKIRFRLDEKQCAFFILKKAQLLSPVCANKLLKTLEEPPPGFNFFLLTNNVNAIIPTIRSRCSIHYTKHRTNDLLLHPILSFFIDTTKLSDPFFFDQELKKQNLTEQETVDLLNDLINSIQKKIIEYNKKCFGSRDLERLQQDKNYDYLQTTVDFLQKQLYKPPQAGGSTMFWRKLFMMFPRKM